MKLLVAGLRLVVGLLFVGHGTQKLFGWFGGSGLDASTDEMRSLQLEPARTNAVLAGGTQAAGGAMLAAGLLTPVGATFVAANMITAIRTACAGKGPWGLNGGWEYQLTLVLALMVLVEQGPGPLSADRLLGTERSGTTLALAALAASAAGSAAAIEAGRRQAADQVSEPSA